MKFNTEDPTNNPLRITAYKILRGHGAAVQSVAAQTFGNMVLSISILEYILRVVYVRLGFNVKFVTYISFGYKY